MNDMNHLSRNTSRGKIRPQPRSSSGVVNRSFVSARSSVAKSKLISDIKITPKSPPKSPIELKTPKTEVNYFDQAVTHASSTKATTAPQKALGAKKLKKSALIGLAAAVLVLTTYVSVDTWMTNNKIKNSSTLDEVAGVSDTVDRRSQEGRDETPPPADYLATYEVAADLPRAIYVDSIGVSARVLPMGVNSDNSIEAPINVFDAGWYTGSVKPGEIGAVFVNAHASGQTREGLFANLDRLNKGDEVVVEKGDRSKLRYRVLDVEVVNLQDVDMKKALLPKNKVLKGMNLMTCAGDWIQDSQTRDKRVIVYTEQIEG